MSDSTAGGTPISYESTKTARYYTDYSGYYPLSPITVIDDETKCYLKRIAEALESLLKEVQSDDQDDG